jgi:demethylmenaquinone methyltransferase/2-methoxy-6-polyprenyl-1,4-benzoquinol methylase
MAVILDKNNGRIAGMFNSIAHRYDLLNHLLSLGIDRIWRCRLVKGALESNPRSALDIACGTGDLTIALAGQGIEVTGLDIAHEMMEYAKLKSKRKLTKKGFKAPIFVCSPAENLPFEENSFDMVSIGFGIRNFNDRSKSLSEIHRVLKPQGKLMILEFASPRNYLWRGVFNLYFRNILPVLGKLISGNSNAYQYLTESVEDFPKYEEFCKELKEAGFNDNYYKPLTGGIALLYTSTK